jgi:hypothetical protein
MESGTIVPDGQVILAPLETRLRRVVRSDQLQDVLSQDFSLSLVQAFKSLEMSANAKD